MSVKVKVARNTKSKHGTKRILLTSMQTELDLRQRTHGGARPGAGRKRLVKKHDPDHRTRPPVVPRHPMHVVLRTLPKVGRLRRREVFVAARREIRRAAEAVAVRDASATAKLVVPFRVVHVSIQHNHVHLLVEADSNAALSAGMRRLTIALARAINRSLGRTGKVFAFRYHRTDITSPRQARHALSYVLNNWRRHRENETTVGAQNAILDPYSTAVLFTGWRGKRFAIPATYEPLPVSDATTWLLNVGWRKHGEIDPLEPPGPIWKKTRAKLRNG